jgi:undecaprenyl-diphosphatase
VASLIHVAFGSPGGRPTARQVAAALAELGVAAKDVRLAPDQSTGATTMLACDGRGPLTIRILGRDEVDAQLLAKFWRLVLYKDGGPTLHLTRLEDVDHEAYALLLAERAGVHTPDLVVAGKAGPGVALIVSRPPAGLRLADVDPAVVTDDVLDEVWLQVGALAEAGVAHGHLNARHIVLTSEGPVIVDFDDAAVTRSPERLAADSAELLYSTATIVGDERAVAAALRGVETEEIVAALPLLQPAALGSELHRWKRHDRRQLKDRLGALRTETARAAGVDEPVLEELYRVSPQNLVMAVGTFIAIAALLTQIGSPSDFWNTIKTADWLWITVALFLALLTNFATAVALTGTVTVPLPLIRTAELQLSMSFSNLALPGVGGMAAQIRFLQKQGVDLASAVASGGLLATAGNIAAQLLLFLLAVALAPTSVHLGHVDTRSLAQIILLIVSVVLVAVGSVFGVKRIRQKVLPPLETALTTIWAAMHSPRRLLLLFGGNIVNTVMYAFVLDACLVAFGGHINYWTLLSLNIFIGTIAALVPLPGGGTAVASVGMTGALTAAGISTEIAVAAVLANQLVASFLPAIPGWFATEDLLRHDYL